MYLDDRIEMDRKAINDAATRGNPPTDINVPWIYRWSPISHYYGDTVRQLLVLAASIMLIAAPFYTDNIYVELPFILVGGLVLIAVSAMTNPIRSGIISADVVASGVGLVIFELWALYNFQAHEMVKFVFREVIAITFLLAFYFSTKTLRNMLMGQVGMPEQKSAMELDGENTGERLVPLTKEEARQALHELNEYEKMEYTD